MQANLVLSIPYAPPGHGAQPQGTRHAALTQSRHLASRKLHPAPDPGFEHHGYTKVGAQDRLYPLGVAHLANQSPGKVKTGIVMHGVPALAHRRPDTHQRTNVVSETVFTRTIQRHGWTGLRPGPVQVH